MRQILLLYTTNYLFISLLRALREIGIFLHRSFDIKKYTLEQLILGLFDATHKHTDKGLVFKFIGLYTDRKLKPESSIVISFSCVYYTISVTFKQWSRPSG